MRQLDYQNLAYDWGNEAETPSTLCVRLIPESDLDKTLLIQCLLAKVKAEFWEFPAGETHVASISLSSLEFDDNGFASGQVSVKPKQFNPLTFLSDEILIPVTFWVMLDHKSQPAPMWRAEHPSIIRGAQENVLPERVVFVDF